MESALLLFLQLTRLIPVIGAAIVGLLLGPTFKVSRVTGACLAALAVVLMSDLRFATVGESPWRWLLLLPLAAVWLAPWIVVPLKLYRQTIPRGAAALEPFDPARHTVHPVSLAWLGRAIATLHAEGFTPLDDVFWPVPGGKSQRAVLMDNQAEGTRALLLAAADGHPGRNDFLTFYTVLQDGRWVGVSNTLQPTIHPRRHDTVGAGLPDVRDAAGLLAAFRAFVRQNGGDGARSLPPGANAREFFEANTDEITEDFIARGWYRRARDGHRLSLRAAFLHTWVTLFPLHQLRIRAIRKKQDGILRGLGLPVPRREPEPARWWLSLGGPQVAGAAALLALGLAWPWLAARGGLGALVPAFTIARADTVVPERLPRGFAVPADFPGAVAALERLTGAKATPLTVDDGFSGESSDAMMVPVAKRRVDALLAGAQPAFLARGFVLFHTQELGGMHGEPEALALFPSRDPIDIVLKLNTNGGNYGIGPPEVAAWLREINREHPFTVTSAGFDFVEARFRRPLAHAEAMALATRVARFCPDVVTQGTGTVRALAREMESSRELYCWWD